jgi:glycosyltransferase involved in cell wall biosynthesis
MLPQWTQAPGKVAIVHDWVTGMRGGEAILDVICELFPNADLVTLLQTDFEMTPTILNGRRIRTSYLQRLMGMRRFSQGYRKLLPIFPHAIESIDMSEYDLILSNTHCVAKGVKKREGVPHIAYVSTPMRYIWDMFDEYFGEGKTDLLTTKAAELVRPYLQAWDLKTTPSVDHLIANSRFVQNRIKQFWNRESTVIHPFVDPAKFENRLEVRAKEYYLIVSAFAPYKRIDLAVEAFAQLKKPLIIVGKGQEEKKLKKLAAPFPWIEFHGGLSDAALGELYRKARAFVFPGLEDFGITPLESLYNGRPVIAYGRGGVLDTITKETGIFFEKQTVDSLMNAVEKMEGEFSHFNAAQLRERSLEFSRQNFREKYENFLISHLSSF